jgi:NDP-sugar pyrophosphorylase family protein
MVIDRLKAAGNFGMHVEFSREDVLLDTGGGMKQAAWFLGGSSGAKEEDPFILHNVDVISSIDLERMVEFHRQTKALATLAVQERKSSRYLLFDQQNQLCGRRLVKEEKTELVRPSQHMTELAFSGIHVISPRIFPLLTEEGIFSIVPAYLRLAAQGERIVAFRADEYYWRDLGKPENIRQAELDIKANLAQ